MIKVRRHPRRLQVCVLAAAVGLSAGCTYFDRFLPGTPFTPDQPVAQVTLEGEMQIDRSDGGSGCLPGGTIIWGLVRNTGDVDVVDVTIAIDTFGPTGDFLGTYQTNVFSGQITEAADTNSFEQVSTSLAVREAGSFEVCTPQPFGSVARTEYRTEFVVIDIDKFK